MATTEPTQNIITPSAGSNPPAAPDIFQPATQTGITRRCFIKRTTATVLVTVLALDAFVPETYAKFTGASSGDWHSILEMLTWGKPLYENTEDHPYMLLSLPDNNPSNPAYPWELQHTPRILQGAGGANVITIGGVELTNPVWTLNVYTRPTGTYYEAPFPTKPDDWGYYAESFTCAWEGYYKFSGVATDPNGQLQAIEITLEDAADIQGSGNLSVDSDTGVVTENPVNPVETILSEGFLPSGQWFRISQVIQASKDHMNVLLTVAIDVWNAHFDNDGNPELPPVNEGRAFGWSVDDIFTFSKRNYVIWK